MKPFYERSFDERVALTQSAMQERRTLFERWSALETAEAVPWNARAALAAELLRDQPSVADFGCGVMTLAHHLKPDQTYIPLDVVARDARTLVCDLNSEPSPPTGAAAAALLGVLEYLYDPGALLARLREQYRVVVVSYCLADSPLSPPDRREHAWVNAFTGADLHALFRAAGWRPEAERPLDGLQTLWRLTRLADERNPTGSPP